MAKFNNFINKDDGEDDLISIILPSYNNGKFIQDAINSILNQSHRNFELIIIDDNSDDDTNSILNSFSDSRIKIIKNDERVGLVNSLNIGIDLARGRFIARMDADDIAKPSRLKEEFYYLKCNPDCVLVGSWFIKFNGNRYKKCKLPTNCRYLSTILLLHNTFAHPTIMGYSNIFKKLKYREYYEDAEDYDLIIRFSKYGKIVNIPKYLLYYRIHNNSISIVQKKSQIHSSNLIRLNLLKEIGIVPNEYEKNIHLNMLCDLHKPISFCPIQLIRWIFKIIDANKKYKKYPDVYLKFILFIRFIEIMREILRYWLGEFKHSIKATNK